MEKRIINFIRNYDISNFRIDKILDKILIYPDEYFLNTIGYNKDFFVSLNIYDDNYLDFGDDLYLEFMNNGNGYKIFKLLINKYDYLTNINTSTKECINIWYYLMTDSELYCFTSLTKSGSILKSCDDKKLIDFYNKYSIVDGVIFDDEFKEKINSII